jgi:hypothetical protein
VRGGGTGCGARGLRWRCASGSHAASRRSAPRSKFGAPPCPPAPSRGPHRARTKQPDPVPDSETETDPETDPVPDPETDPDPVPDADPETDPETDPRSPFPREDACLQCALRGGGSPGSVPFRANLLPGARPRALSHQPPRPAALARAHAPRRLTDGRAPLAGAALERLFAGAACSLLASKPHPDSEPEADRRDVVRGRLVPRAGARTALVSFPAIVVGRAGCRSFVRLPARGEDKAASVPAADNRPRQGLSARPKDPRSERRFAPSRIQQRSASAADPQLPRRAGQILFDLSPAWRRHVNALKARQKSRLPLTATRHSLAHRAAALSRRRSLSDALDDSSLTLDDSSTDLVGRLFMGSTVSAFRSFDTTRDF